MRVSVIIPCYNQGQTLDRTVQSVLKQNYNDYEIIIVNDGSTDEATIQAFKQYEHIENIFILHTNNQGLSAARNNGIKMAKGNYILPLDADDTIAAHYMQEAVKTLDANSEIGIVYGLAEFTGSMQGLWSLPPASLERLLTRNVIYASAFFRKTDWEKVGGYNTNMRYGLEDWDFWLSILELGRKIERIEKVVFYYFIAPKTMTKSLQLNLKHNLYSYFQLISNHKKLYLKHPAHTLKLLIIIARNVIYHLLGKKVQR